VLDLWCLMIEARRLMAMDCLANMALKLTPNLTAD
jgi:hypothetical protein